MAALLVDCNSSSSKLTASKPQIRPSEQFLTAGVSSRIADDNSDDKVDCLVSSSFKPNTQLSSVIMMNSANSSETSKTNGLEIQSTSQLTHQSGDKAIHGIGNYLSETSKKKISSILNEVEKLNDIEKLYLYLELPDGTSNSNENINNDKKKVLYNPFGKKTDTEVIQTYTWIQSHLEEDNSVSIPKHEVYEDYKVFCEVNKFDKLCVADFGKAMKHIFPHVKPRRLGQRGNSKYCYSGLRKKILVETPELPVLDTSEYKFGNEERDIKKNLLVDDVSWNVILDWVEKTFNRKFKSSIDFARHLIETQNIDLSKALKINENKANNHLVKCLVSKSPTAKKKDIYNQIKKLPDKKKCDNQGGTEKSFLSTNATNRVKANSSSICSDRTTSCSKLDGIDNLNLAAVTTMQTTVKTEPDETAFPSPTSKVLSKVPMQRNSFINSSPTIILLSGSQTIPSETSNHLSTLNNKNPKLVNHTVCAMANSSTIKYKPIQPKPANLESENECFDSLISTNIDKRRHSVATPFNVDSNKSDIKKELECFSNFGSIKLIDNDKNYKRQIDEKDFQFMSKKRHVEENVSALSNSILIDNFKPQKLTSNSTSIDNSDLKVNEIESEALYDYLNTNITPNLYENVTNQDNQNTFSDANKESFVQIRKLLENHLGHNSGINANDGIKPNDDISNNLSNSYTENSNSNSHGSMSKSSYQYNDNSLSGIVSKDNGNLDGLSSNCSLLNNGQIPPSPNARRRAFSFQPISPRNTPTIPENSTLDMNMFGKGPNYNGFNSSQIKQMNTVAVGPSQPPSENNSPFISPRNTPVPCSVSRSRNNSGQSTYSNYRQTPLPNFDSGVSSISSSPFVSPHSTPIPAGTPRIRPLDNVNHSRNLARVRHSSGPGGPINRSQVSNLMLYNRSNSLSPMIGDNAFLFSNPNFNVSTQSLNSTIAADNIKFNEDLVNKLSVVTQTEPKMQIEQSQFGLQFNSILDNNLPFQSKSLHRQRHFSNPYGGAATNSALMKPDENESFKMLLNRSQSVPLNQMFQSNIFDSNLSIDPQFSNFSPMVNNNGSTSGLDPTISKSYPATPLCNDSFKLPHLTSIGTSTSSAANASLEPNGFLSGSSIEDLLNNNDSVIQSGQDLIVSSVQLNQGITSGNDTNATSSVDDLNVPSPLMLTKNDRDEFNDLLINDNVVEHFQSLDEFRDCDNDFSNIELENQANPYDDVFKFT